MPLALKAQFRRPAAKPKAKSAVEPSRTALLARLRREYTPAVCAATLKLNDSLPAEKP